MSNQFSFRWGVDLFDNEHTQIPNWVLAHYHQVGVTNTEMMFIIHLASFKYETPVSEARPSLTKTLRERMGYKSNQGIINVQDGLIKKGLLIVHKRPGCCSVYDFTPFSKQVIKIALTNEIENDDYPPTESSTKLDDSRDDAGDHPSTKLDDHPSTKLDGSRQQNLTRRKEEEKKVRKEDSADADYQFPISNLTLEQVKEKEMVKRDWETWLENERAERNRKGVISFIDLKLKAHALRPEGEKAQALFEALAQEYEAKGRRPPTGFPTLACKKKFNQAVGDLNGTFEMALTKAIENGITSIPGIVNYISSPKWRENNGNKGSQNDGKKTNHKGNGTSAAKNSRTGGAKATRSGNDLWPGSQPKVPPRFQRIIDQQRQQQMAN